MRVVDIPEEVYDLFRTGGSSLEDGAFREEDIEAIVRKSPLMQLRNEQLIFMPIEARRIPGFPGPRNSIILDSIKENCVADTAEVRMFEETVIYFMDKIHAVVARVLAENGNEEKQGNTVHRLAFEGLHPDRHSADMYRWENKRQGVFVRRETPDVMLKFRKKMLSATGNPHPSMFLPDHPRLLDERYYFFNHDGRVGGFGVIPLIDDDFQPSLSVLMDSMPIEEALSLTCDAMRTCAEAVHPYGLVHRDFKPSNILPLQVEEDGEDGESKFVHRGCLADHELVGPDCWLTPDLESNVLNMVGTPMYSDGYWYNNQYFVSSYHYQPATDVFAAGMSLLECYFDSKEFRITDNKPGFAQYLYNLIREHPIRRGGYKKILERIREVLEIYPPREPIPEPMLQLIARMMAPKSKKRPTMEQAVATVEDFYGFDPPPDSESWEDQVIEGPGKSVGIIGRSVGLLRMLGYLKEAPLS